MLLCDGHDSYVGLDFCDNAIRTLFVFTVWKFLLSKGVLQFYHIG